MNLDLIYMIDLFRLRSDMINIDANELHGLWSPTSMWHAPDPLPRCIVPPTPHFSTPYLIASCLEPPSLHPTPYLNPLTPYFDVSFYLRLQA